MSKIRILPEDVSNCIAAGEVIERPASIVKELTENSLDAKATHISIHISRGGRSLVRVIDDGIGMDSEDAILCLEAHATSKISSAHDIASIASFGFRGEALPSIASVSRLELKTCLRDGQTGTEVIVDAGVIKSVSEVGTAPGTSISVKSLFYNIPARRKFLRTIKTEELHIQECVLWAALANPNVGFQLTFDSRPAISVQAKSDLLTRATMLLGKDVMASMLSVAFESNEIAVFGFVARPGLGRNSRREQRIFVNSRPVESNTVYHAIRDAYHTLVMKGRYPPTLLFIRTNPEFVDVNVHPAKREVRFRNSREIGQVVASGIRSALRGVIDLNSPVTVSDNGNTSFPLPTLPQKAMQSPSLMHSMDVINGISNQLPIADSPRINITGSHANPDRQFPDTSIPGPVTQSNRTDTNQSTNPTVYARREDIRNLRILGAIADLFLVAEGSDGLVLVDQHAAHERVLFEKVLAQAKLKDGTAQGLLIPITLDFSQADSRILKSNLPHLLKLGFHIENFGGNTFIITSVPAHFPQQNIAGILHDIIDDLRDSPLGSRRIDEAIIAQTACKAAVKAHDHLTHQEIDKLMADLVAAELPYTCPHGRPTMINISIKELEKRFGRRQ